MSRRSKGSAPGSEPRGSGGNHQGPELSEMGRKPREWERQPKESEEAFEAFAAYRDQTPPRSVREVCKEVGKSNGLVTEWSRRDRWVARVAAWDREQDRVKREADLKGQVEMGKRHAAESAELQDALLMPAREMVRRYREAQEKGEDPFKGLSMLDLIKEATKAARVYAQVGVFERLSRGLSTTNVGGHEGGPIEVEHRERVEKMPRSELEAYLLGVDDGRAVAEKYDLPAPPGLTDEGDV